MDEFGEEHSIYVWPLDQEDGEPYPDDFYDRIGKALDEAGIGWDTT